MKPTLYAGLVATLCFATPAFAQEQPKEKKNITVDVDRNETVENGVHKSKIKVIRKVNGKEEVIEREFTGEMPADLQQQLKAMNIDLKNDSTMHTVDVQGNKDGKKVEKVIIMKNSGCNDKEAKKECKFDFTFSEKGELPADVKKMLEEKNIKFEGGEGKVYVFKHNRKEGDAQWNGKDGNFFFFDTNGGENSTVNVYKLDNGKEVRVCISKVCVIKIDDEKEASKKAEEGKAEGANEPEVAELTVFPNPNDGEFNLRFKLPQKGDAHISLLDKNGKVVYEEKLKDFSGEFKKPLRLKDQPTGQYVLRIAQNGKVYTRQVLVK